jgi:predicted transcriptional regulator
MNVVSERHFISGDHLLQKGRFLKIKPVQSTYPFPKRELKDVGSSFSHLYTLEKAHDIYEHQYQMIEEAKVSIKLVSFVFDSGPLVEKLVDLLIKKANEDVAVKVFTTLKTNDLKIKSIANSEDIDFNSHSKIVRKMADSGIQLRARNDCHGKFCITDHTKALISSANLTDNSYNRNPEFGCIFTNDLEVRKISHIFDHMWNHSYQFYVNNNLGEFMIEERIPVIETYQNLFPFKSFHEDYEIMFTYVETTSFSEKIVKLIETAKEDIIISSYLVRALDLSPIGKALENALHRGVKVKIITRPSNHRFDHLQGCLELAKKGAVIIGNSFNHAKIFSFDRNNAAIFTGNLDGLHGLENGIEFGVLLKNHDYTAFAIEFNQLLEDDSAYLYQSVVSQQQLSKEYGKTITLPPLTVAIPKSIQSGYRTFNSAVIFERLDQEEIRASIDTSSEELKMVTPEYLLLLKKQEDGTFLLDNFFPSYHTRYHDESRRIKEFLVDTVISLRLIDAK